MRAQTAWRCWHKHEDAYRDACEAVELRRGLIRNESEFVSSLHLAAVEAHHLGNSGAAVAFEAEAEQLTERLQISHFQLAKRAAALSRAFSSDAADEILREAEAANNLEIVAAVQVFRANRDMSLSDSARLELLEETLRRIATSPGRRPMVAPVKQAIAAQLVAMGDLPRAAAWFREILASNPFDLIARDGFVACLWKMEKWADAAAFLKKHMELCGEMPGLMFSYGKSLFEAGDMSGAVTALTKAANIAGDNADLRRSAIEVRDQALALGGTILAPSAPVPIAGPVTRDEFEVALEEFAMFVSAAKRMSFWTKDGDGKPAWVSSPERHAQDLLHTYLQAKLGERVNIFEELATGAGRLDLYVQLSGGLSIVLELKMCGGRYASSYAAAGEEQINHYMNNRKTNLGYLVVFDARAGTFGQPLVAKQEGPHTIIEKIVDVRPRVKK